MIVAQDFLDHWKTRQLVGLLGGDECAPLYVLRLWAHCQARKTHKFPQLSAESLAGICRFAGAPSALWLAFQTCGFSEVKGEVFIAHQWDQYNKSLTNSWKNGRYGGRKRKPTGIPTAPPNGTHGGVEKRREEKSRYTIPSAAVAAPGEAPDGRHHAVTSKWSEVFKTAHGIDYVFTPRDAVSLKRLLSVTKESAPEIFAVAQAAWERAKSDRYAKNCKMASTLHGLCSAYNEIRVELLSAEANETGKMNFA
jgi:hypothetical protein